MEKIRDNFKVVTVSSNANSFGLKNMIVIDREGRAFSTCASTLNLKKQGEILVGEVNLESGNVSFSGCELTRELNTAPKEVIKEVWK